MGSGLLPHLMIAMCRHGKQSDYRKYRRKADSYRHLVTLLQGRARDCVENLTVENVAKPEACATVFEGLIIALIRYHKWVPIGLLELFHENATEEWSDLAGASNRVPPYRMTMVHKTGVHEKIRA